MSNTYGNSFKEKKKPKNYHKTKGSQKLSYETIALSVQGQGKENYKMIAKEIENA